ncbi:MAG: reverse transcriptase-like protein [Actinobacteria bacterium]|jgi:probable phosphoglycerate mutase|nr:reverse transcriptase-like protein [Actinomycetota bacterium]NDA38880.1 reverse transcriptase-like protein [Actinomycetota bacterium]NDE12622.1 reverse transcriptase-like protein [Actinomycetota bacterium]NDE83669.1 reverse transcriptase-like protein [Actinomycetota bacterium]
MSRSFLLYADGGSRGNPGEAAFGAVISESGKVIVELSERIGIATNNVAEYSALIAGLRAINKLDPQARVLVRMDSKLIVEQMSGKWKIKNPEMRKMALQAREAHAPERVEYEWIPREMNSDADSLVNLALDS